MLDPVRQRRPLDEFEDQGANGILLLEPVDAPDVGVVQRGEDLGFSLEPGEPIWVRREGRRQLEKTNIVLQRRETSAYSNCGSTVGEEVP